jgi:hypothetical protein
MKRINDILIFAGCLALIAFTSCIKDLDTKPKSESILLPEEAWGKAETYNQFVAKIYATFALSGNEGPAGMQDIVGADQGEATFVRSYWNLQELTTDEAVCAWSDDGLSGLQYCNWTSSNRFCELSYNRMMLNVAYVNEFLRQTTDEKMNARGITSAVQSEVHTYRMEVKAIRAMNYYFLIDLFANIPYIDEADGVGAFLPAQKDRAFFFPWIEAELKACEGQLPTKSAANYGKVNDPTVWMVLAKLYLNAEVYIGQAKYSEALTYLNKIVNAGYTLDGVYKHLFGADNDLSNEIIFPVIFDGKRATCYGGTTYLMAGAYASDMNPATNFGLAQNWSGLRAKETLSGLFAANDSRALFWKQDRTLDTRFIGDFKSGWGVIKYTNVKRDGTFGSDLTFPDTDFPMFRLADAYLMYAEAVLRGGQGGSRATALDYVNSIRERAGAATIGDAQLTLDWLIEERARELYWEGHRRTDLIRFNMFTANYAWPWKNGVYSGTTNLDSKYKIFPIPAAELTANPNIKQNTGY